MANLRVLVLYNEPVLAVGHPDAESEHEILYTLASVEKGLLAGGFHVEKLAVSHNPKDLVDGLLRTKPDVVFNLFEGTGDDGSNESYAAGVLQWMKVPYTGCPAETLNLARNKPLTKHLLRSAGIPTAEFMVLECDDVSEVCLNWPLIVKPACQDASVGLDQGSVVTDSDQLQLRVASLLKRFKQPVLVEEFIPGRELNVALVEIPELTVLPISEILFVEPKPGFWPIVTYDAKWKPLSEDYIATPPKYPAEISSRLTKRLGDIAKKAFRLTGCRDYARIDFRVKPTGRPYVLEVNPNPDFSPEAGFSAAFQTMGFSHGEFAIQMVHNALARAGKPRASAIGLATPYDRKTNGLLPVGNH